ncbi:hypothetical protein TOPH_02152 [Tolypocladium ophioglossoides CBS 100239]|uniref:HAUS augmin-like complex subunit 1 n=1 Tax=Tolypocladium ophioglossoides (strain CBS 100239) TaxID=1163406 RepID=A0A0L0NG94_TOLOC|nr:hypothetical protein TOPH_02152 [Tolypocladium ophioglossoides CBS 100239]
MAHLHRHRRHLSQHDDSAAIFSPSVARIAASTARDWSYVDLWLASKFPPGRSVPSFERNPDTLKALLALAAANESADEERQLLARADAAALKQLEHHGRQREAPGCEDHGHSFRPGLLRSDLLTAIEHALPKEGRTALDSLANLAVQAGTALPEPDDLGRNITNLQGSVFEVEQMIARVESLQRHMQREADQAAELLQVLLSDRYRPSSDLAKQNLDLQRKTKALTVQLPELQDRAVAYRASVDPSHPTIEDVAREEHDFLALLGRKNELHVQMAAFAGLPSDPDMARQELDTLRRQLRGFTSRRDAMFEGLVERESPVKRR